MKYQKLIVIGMLLASSHAHRLSVNTSDEVDELMEKQD